MTPALSFYIYITEIAAIIVPKSIGNIFYYYITIKSTLLPAEIT